jgi:hypothetical protein
MKPLLVMLIVLVGLLPRNAWAHGEDVPDPNLHVNPTLKDCEVWFAPELTQGAYHRFVKEFGSASAFKLMAPPTALGRWGVSLAVEGIGFTVEEHADAWNDTFAHPDATHELGSHKQFPKLRARVGLSDRLDLGAFFTENPQANYGWVGLEAKYTALREGPAMPVTLAVRGAYTKTLFVHDMDMHALTADVAAGRTWAGGFTPYVGVGGDLVFARERSEVVDLKNELVLVPHVLAGVEVRYWRATLGAEVNQAALTHFQVQVAARF